MEPENQIADMIEIAPELFGKGGTKRDVIEANAKALQYDEDFTRGVDDDFTAWNLPEEK